MRIGLLTGGGDCPGLNPALRGFVYRATERGHACFGIKNGWKGLIDPAVSPLTIEAVRDISSLGGTILGTSRVNPFKPGRENELERIHSTLSSEGIDVLAVFGGIDTLGVAWRLFQRGINIVGVPKTMDNDLAATDFTLGFDSAVSVAVESIDRLRDTARSHSRVIVVEVMGWQAGWVALYAGAASGADWVLLPETPPDLEAMCRHLTSLRDHGKYYSLIVVAEGVELPEESGSQVNVDSFGHLILRDRRVGEYIASEISKRTGFETRHVALGHIIRGGSPTAFDRLLSMRLGMKAAELADERQFGQMASLNGLEFVGVDLGEALASIKRVPSDLINELKVLFDN